MYRHKRQLKAGIRCVAVAAALCVWLTVPAAAFGWTVNTSTRTEAEMRVVWDTLKPVYGGVPYAVTPSVVAPFAPGDMAAGARTDSLNAINWGRYLAGVPYDVTTTAEYNLTSQYGAVLLKANGALSHTPPRPAGMDDYFYNRGCESASRSNIGSGYSTSVAFQKGCFDDSAPSNLPTLGHRRWLLYPTTLVTGIGYAERYHTTYVMSYPRRSSAEVAYTFISWPSPGIFPVENISSATPWSITVNPALYDWDTGGPFTVTLRRVSDGVTWVFTASDTNTSGEYFNANFGGFGVGNAFIFRPNPSSISYNAGDQFDVTLTGAIFDQGTRTPVAIQYRTSFGALSGAATSFLYDTGGNTTPPPTPAPPPPADAAPGKMPVYRFYNRSNGSHFYTASVAERDRVIATLGGTYSYEGAAYTVDTTNPVNDAFLYRFYNRANGSHFYTASEGERDRVIATLGGTYAYEGPAYKVSLSASGTSPMYRFYNNRNGSHFYTISAAERDAVIASLGGTYTYEGPAFYLAQ